MTEEFLSKLKQDEEYNDIIEKLTTQKKDFKQKLEVDDKSLFWTFDGVWGVCFKNISKLDL